MNVSFIGLGKLGLPLACCLAQAGNKILGVDKNEYVLDKLSNNVTIILIAHRLNTLRKCDLIYKLEEGQIVGKGTYDKIINHN